MTEITQEELKAFLDYDPGSGLFTWRARPKVKAGKIAGCKTTQHGRTTILIRTGGKAKNKLYLAHRLAFLWMTGEMPEQVDHINRNPCDNRWVNLRAATPEQNSRNLPLKSGNKTGIHGVRWANDRGKWRASISNNGKVNYLYSGDDFFEACCARKAAERRYDYHPNHGKQL
jgi:hypothetical protein